MLGKKKELEIPVYLFMGFLEAGRHLYSRNTEEDYLTTEKDTFICL